MPGQIGVQEGATWALLAVAGLDSWAALALSLARRLRGLAGHGCTPWMERLVDRARQGQDQVRGETLGRSEHIGHGHGDEVGRAFGEMGRSHFG